MAIGPKKIRRTARERSKLRIRKRVSGVGSKVRISVFKSSLHTYAQAIDDLSGRTLASACTRDAEVLATIGKVAKEVSHSEVASAKSVRAAHSVGLVIAKKLQAVGVSAAVFDRNGYVYHGRIKAVADGARAGGLPI